MSEYNYVVEILRDEIGKLSHIRRELELKGITDSVSHKRIKLLESAIKRLKENEGKC